MTEKYKLYLVITDFNFGQSKTHSDTNWVNAQELTEIKRKQTVRPVTNLNTTKKIKYVVHF